MGIFKFNLKTNELNFVANGLGPSISPDGKTLAYSRREKNKNSLYLHDLGKKAETAFVIDTFSNGSPQWSPNGKFILYTRETGFGREVILDIRLVDVESRKITEVAPGGKFKNFKKFFYPSLFWTPLFTKWPQTTSPFKGGPK